jgi:hypothetical protein
MSHTPRQAQIAGAVGFLLALALPAVLFGHIVVGIAGEFEPSLHYLLAEWTPWALIVIGLGFLLPVAWSAGRDPESRWYPHGRNAYAGWGVTLYLLGFGLGTQVASIWSLSA